MDKNILSNIFNDIVIQYPLATVCVIGIISLVGIFLRREAKPTKFHITIFTTSITLAIFLSIFDLWSNKKQSTPPASTSSSQTQEKIEKPYQSDVFWPANMLHKELTTIMKERNICQLEPISLNQKSKSFKLWIIENISNCNHDVKSSNVCVNWVSYLEECSK